MEKPYLLHMITPEKNISPFDANMAFDAGWDSIIPYTNVTMEEIQALVQDTIFSRSPSTVSKRTAIFIGGRDTHIAMDMLEETKKHMVPPFEVPVFADPSGAFTTAAGMVAKTEKALKDKFNLDFENLKIAILGGTGPVGVASAVISSKAGNDVILIAYSVSILSSCILSLRANAHVVLGLIVFLMARAFYATWSCSHKVSATSICRSTFAIW